MSEPTTADPAAPFDVMNPPDHTQLPDRDGAIVNNFQEHPQSALLTGSLTPRLQEIHPDGLFAIGEDCGIYFRHTQPVLAGCKAPDWFYVPGVPPMLDGVVRRSYVLWNEVIPPLLVIEYVSGDGSEEHDATPHTGKFWVYERAIRSPYYLIFDRDRATLEVYRQSAGTYQVTEPNERGRFLIKPLRVEFGLWQGTYRGLDTLWLRAWDQATGELLPSPEEREERERNRAETAEELLDDARQRLEEETERAETERRRAVRLEEKLRALGFDPNAM